MRLSTSLKLVVIFSLLLPLIVSFAWFGSTRATVHATSIPLKLSTKSTQKSALTTTCGAWSVIPSPNAQPQDFLYGVTALSSSDVWAVGSSSNAGGNVQTLIEHWDGTSWSLIPSPNVETVSNVLYGVAVVSAQDVWAVGYYDEHLPRTLIEHWDGTTWSIVPSPSPAYYANYLFKLAVVSSNNIWAVGHDFMGAYQTLIEHWDGSSWSIVPSPNPGPQNFLSGITAISGNDIWAVGHYADYSGGGSYQSQILVEHWDGTSWSVAPSLNPSTTFDELADIARVPGTKQLWVVGRQYYGFNGSPQTLIEHWNGLKWAVVPSPNASPTNNDLAKVAAISAHKIWAVGSYSDSNNVPRTLIERWNGTGWSIVASPSPGSNQNGLSGVTRIPGTGLVWAVGYYANQNIEFAPQTLTEFYC